MNCHVFVMRPSRDRRFARLLRHPSFVTPDPACPRLRAGKPGSNHGSPCRRSRWRTGSTAGATVGGMRCEASGARCVNPAGPSRGLRRRARVLGPASPPVRGEGRSRSCVPPSRQWAGRGVPVSRVIARVCVRGRGRAYRGGAARAPDCARETADAPRPSVPAGVFFAAPGRRFLQKRRKAAPEAASLYFHSTPYRQKSSPFGNIK